MATGGMAAVWCAEDLLLDRTVAVKLMAEQLSADPAAVRRFKREARAAARLSGHPNVVTIYDVGQAEPEDEYTPGRPFIVMERLLGGSVADAMRAAPIRPERAIRWLRQAAAAIDYGHGRGIIHRDIKPSNLLLDATRMLHVADFGIALVATEDTLTASGQLLGTAGYLAPEVALGQPATEASDRYALAVAAFELLTGSRPFRATHFAAQARQHIESPPPRASARNPRLPAAVDEVLARGMAKRPEERFSSAEELVAAIDAALQERTAVTAPAPVVPAPSAPAAPPSSAPAPATAATAPLRRRPRPASTSRRARIAALAALGALMLGVGLAAAEAGGGGGLHASGIGAAAKATGSRSGHPAAPSTSVSHTAATSAPALPGSADALEARGHALMESGDYAAAIPVLRQAVAAANHSSLTYAYALYDLGRSLRLAGDPQAAIPILEQRLQIPNQTGVVRAELALAQAQAGHGGAAGGGAQPPAGPPPGPADHKHKPGHGPGDGGD